MRWKRLTYEEREVVRKKYLGNWHREFALRPCYDLESRTVYWLEFVWCRGSGEWRGAYETKNDFTKWEYRGGRQCPEVKQPPRVTNS